jgi:hypothetical protein
VALLRQLRDVPEAQSVSFVSSPVISTENWAETQNRTYLPDQRCRPSLEP